MTHAATDTAELAHMRLVSAAGSPALEQVAAGARKKRGPKAGRRAASAGQLQLQQQQQQQQRALRAQTNQLADPYAFSCDSLGPAAHSSGARRQVSVQPLVAPQRARARRASE